MAGLREAPDHGLWRPICMRGISSPKEKLSVK
jgi:hypothetical protein